MTTFTAVAGDINAVDQFRVGGLLNGASIGHVEAHVSMQGQPTVTLPCSVVDVGDRRRRRLPVVEVSYGGWLQNLAVPGRWRIEFQMRFAGGVEMTWPSDGADLLIVRPEIS